MSFALLRTASDLCLPLLAGNFSIRGRGQWATIYRVEVMRTGPREVRRAGTSIDQPSSNLLARQLDRVLRGCWLVEEVRGAGGTNEWNLGRILKTWVQTIVGHDGGLCRTGWKARAPKTLRRISRRNARKCAAGAEFGCLAVYFGNRCLWQRKANRVSARAGKRAWWEVPVVEATTGSRREGPRQLKQLPVGSNPPFLSRRLGNEGISRSKQRKTQENVSSRSWRLAGELVLNEVRCERSSAQGVGFAIPICRLLGEIRGVFGYVIDHS